MKGTLPLVKECNIELQKKLMKDPRTTIKECQFVGFTYTHIDTVCARRDKLILNAGRSHLP